MKKTIFNISALATLAAPAMAFAQTPNFGYVDSWVNHAYLYLRYAITIITVLMTIFFLINVFRFISTKDPKAAAEYRKLMINGIIGLFVSVAVWGIIGLVGNITGINTQSSTSPRVTCPPGLTAQSDGTCANGTSLL